MKELGFKQMTLGPYLLSYEHVNFRKGREDLLRNFLKSNNSENYEKEKRIETCSKIHV